MMKKGLGGIPYKGGLPTQRGIFPFLITGTLLAASYRRARHCSLNPLWWTRKSLEQSPLPTCISSCMHSFWKKAKRFADPDCWSGTCLPRIHGGRSTPDPEVKAVRRVRCILPFFLLLKRGHTRLTFIPSGSRSISPTISSRFRTLTFYFILLLSNPISKRTFPCK